MRLPVVLRFLVFTLPVLVVSFAVCMGAAAIARLAGDKVAEWVLNSAGVVALLALAVDLILLAGVLGVKSLMDFDRLHNERRKKNQRQIGKRKRHGRRRSPGGRKGGRGHGPNQGPRDKN